MIKASDFNDPEKVRSGDIPFGVWLKTNRIRNELLQKQLAVLANVSDSRIADIERGFNTSLNSLDLFAKVFDKLEKDYQEKTKDNKG